MAVNNNQKVLQLLHLCFAVEVSRYNIHIFASSLSYSNLREDKLFSLTQEHNFHSTVKCIRIYTSKVTLLEEQDL